mmetsp:Transcript_14792/g.2465  ORF Transcript_14792/g.2465 Transcript_14792/m.2465 type:complete len:112 (+) Transcript_14792:393-728(+)
MSTGLTLQARNDFALSDRSCFKVEVSPLVGPAMHFLIRSKFKIRQEGDKVTYNDRILFINQKMEKYLHLSEHPMDIAYSCSATIANIPDLRPHPQLISKIHEVNVSDYQSS